jgi:hypothetical protein
MGASINLTLIATRSAWNKTSLIFRKGEGGLGMLGRGWSDNAATTCGLYGN